MLPITADRAGRRPGLDQLTFWGMNIGLVIFLVRLAANEVALKRIGAPLMGVAPLLGLALALERRRLSNLAAADA